MIDLLKHSFILNYNCSMALYNHYALIIKLIHKTYLLKWSETVHNTIIVMIDKGKVKVLI